MKILIVSALLFPALASAATFRVGPNCTYTTIQAAIDAADRLGGENVVRLVKGADPRPQALTIDGQYLTIIGGADFCNDGSDPDIDERTVVSGAGGAAAPVITITGVGVVTLANVVIANGDNAGRDGGGIAFRGSANEVSELHLVETTVTNNEAGNGAGIHFSGPGPSVAELVFHEDVGIFRNTASDRGGGVGLAGRVRMRTGRERFFFHENKAARGGALAVVGEAQADLGTAQWLDQYTFKGNEAEYGGALYVDGTSNVPSSSNSVSLYSIDPSRPMQLVDNAASREGGAVYAVGALDVTYDTARICTRRVNFIGNRLKLLPGAPFFDGGAVAHLRGTATFGECPTVDFPSEAIAACAPETCGVFSNNHTNGGAQTFGSEAIFTLFQGARIELRNAIVKQNRANQLFNVSGALGSARRSRADLANVLVVNNPTVRTDVGAIALHVTDHSELVARNVTLSVAGPSYGIFANAAPNTMPLISMRSSIVSAQAGVTLGTPLQTRTNWTFEDVMVDELPASFADVPGAIDRNPLFASDYSLRDGSPAIDVSSGLQGDNNYDLYDRPRVDRCSISNGPGIIDLGAIESQGSPDVVFGAGFEESERACR